MSLIVKFVFAGSVVVAATWLASRSNTLIGALVGAFPYITLLVITFTYIETGGNRANLTMLSKHFSLMIFSSGIFPLVLFTGLNAGLSAKISGVVAVAAMLVTQALLLYFFRGDIGAL